MKESMGKSIQTGKNTNLKGGKKKGGFDEGGEPPKERGRGRKAHPRKKKVE